MSAVYRGVQRRPPRIICCIDLSATVQQQFDHLLMTFRGGENQWTTSDNWKLNIGIHITIQQGEYGRRVASIDGVQEAKTTAMQAYRNKNENECGRWTVIHVQNVSQQTFPVHRTPR